MLTVQDIRKAYPAPRPFTGFSARDAVNEYCVGGAFCLFANQHLGPVSIWRTNGLPDPEPTASTFRFPPEYYIARRLRAVNPKLDDETAETFALMIANQNDQGNMDAAWDALERALNYDPANQPGGDQESLPKPNISA